jgi:hypothetical protein
MLFFARSQDSCANRSIQFQIAAWTLLFFLLAFLNACGTSTGQSSSQQSTSATGSGSGGSGTSSGSGGTTSSGSGSSGTTGSSGSGNGGSTGGSGGSTGGSGSSGGGSGQQAPSFANLQRSGGWGQYAQAAPSFVDCSPSPCDGITFSMTQGVSSPSLSGNASQFNIGTGPAFTDALFNNHLIGSSSSQNLPDTDGTLVPSLHNFTYDVYFYGDNLGVSQALEFDINQFFNGMGFIWGHECRIAGGYEWDIWDNVNQHWTPTGIPCHPNSNAWNHLTIQVQRTSNNQLIYQSITLNGETSTLNSTFPHGSAPSSWYGVTVNYQMDGDSKQDPYSIYLDQLTFTYQ